MKTWYIHWDGEATETSISGETLVEAIESQFEMIGRKLGIGNVAGWRLDRVTMEYVEGILGGKGGVVLTVSAYGSRALVNYKEEAEPHSKSVWIHADREDCPALYSFEIRKTQA